MIDKFTLIISSNKEIDEFLKNMEDSTKINHFHLEIVGADKVINERFQPSNNTEITDENFFKLCEKIKKLDLYNRIHFDFSSLPNISEKWTDVISDTLQNFNPREINFNFSDSSLSDYQFERLLKNSSKNMDNLEKLHLIMENINITQNKIKSIEEIVESLKTKKLNHVFLNLKRNEIKEYTLNNLNEIMGNIIIREIYL
jgi:hypothetical protein